MSTLEEVFQGPLPQVIFDLYIKKTKKDTTLFFSGRLCTWTHTQNADRRLDYTFETFERFRNSLRLECAEDGNAAVLTVTPNDTWPDVVYYNSYTHPYMGWRINIVDDFSKRYLQNDNSAPNIVLGYNKCFIITLVSTVIASRLGMLLL